MRYQKGLVRFCKTYYGLCKGRTKVRRQAAGESGENKHGKMERRGDKGASHIEAGYWFSCLTKAYT